jgi:intracellular septation protein A
MNKIILKNLTYALLPIIAYIIADSFFEDSPVSIIIAAGISAIEFSVTFIVYKKADLFIFFDLLLIGFMGGISIALKDPVFFKLKPAIIEAALFIFMLSLCFSKKLFSGYLSRYLKNIEIKPEAVRIMQRNFLILLPVIFIHTILIIISAFYFSKEIWAFVSGFLLYILLGIVFVWIFIMKIIKKIFET